MTRAWLPSLLLACLGLSGCGQERAPTATRSASAPAAAQSAQTTAAVLDPSRLPEDRVAGARSEAQWREHLQEEERERKVLFDRRRLKQHRQVLAALRETRARYDRARTAAALLALKRDWPRLSGTIQQRIDKLDRWGNSSNLLGEYAALLRTLSGDYPDGRLAALSGSPEQLVAATREADLHTKKIVDWLAYVERAETEFDD